HGSEATSAVPPVHTVRPGIVRRAHVLPPSSEEATRSVRADTGPLSCFQVATILRGFAGLTVIAGSVTKPATWNLSNPRPGPPAANGLGPDATRSSFTRYGPAPCGPRPAPLATPP